MPPDELIRYLHAAYAAPADGVTDGELLRRCAAGRDDAAFELLMRRHADLVWRVCRAVARDHHAAEDAFQATFLALARRAAAVGPGTAAGWLCRVAYHAALKARPRPAPDLAGEPAAAPDDAAEKTDRADLARVLHEELDRLADRYRAPLVLCYLQGFTHAEAARRLGWPAGTVATRVARGRDRLRDRLTRRGFALPAGGLVAAFAAGPASALPPSVIPAVARAGAAGTDLPPHVHRLAHGALSAMTRTKTRTAAAAVAVALALTAGAVFTFAGSADPPAPPAPPPAEERAKEKPVERPVPVGPGIQAMASASTDIIIADVLETNPSKAQEGARDTVQLKVVRTLLGRPALGDTLGVYYHLLWADEKGETLEPPKFEKGKRYVIFLRSHVENRREEGKRIAYELTDQWLAVRPDHVALVKEVAAAVRVAHGDARGEWSSTDGVMAGLQGRLVVYRGEPSNGTPILAVYLDLRNTSGGDNTVEFAPERSKMKWSVTDADGKAVAPIGVAGSWPPTPKLRLVLASGEGGRLRLDVTGAGIMKDKGAHLEFGSESLWVFDRGDKGPYDLGGTITIAPSGADRPLWTGTLELPRVRLPLGGD